MSDSLRVVVKVAGLAVLIFTLSLGLAMGLVACGDDGSTGTTGIVVTTQSGGGGSSTTAPVANGGALVGKWSNEATGETFEFTAEGKLNITKQGRQDLVYSYTVEGGDLILTLEATAGASIVSYSIVGDTLTIQDPKLGETTLPRVK